MGDTGNTHGLHKRTEQETFAQVEEWY